MPHPCILCKGGYDAADTTVFPAPSKPGRTYVRGSRPSQSARRTGHPRCCRRWRGQKPGHPPCARENWGWTQSVLGKLATRAGSRSRGRTCATNGPRGDLPPSVHPAPCVRKNRCFVGGMAIGSDNKSGNGSHNCKVAVDPRGDSVQGILTIKMNIIQPLRPSRSQFTAPTVGREFWRQKSF